MADPETPELRAELQREDRPATRNRYADAPPRLGGYMLLWVLFLAAVIGVIAYVYGWLG